METNAQVPELYFPPVLDSTMLTCFDACPQKFLMEFVIRRTPIGRSIHLHAGGCFAKALETIRKGWYLEGLTFDECLLKAWDEFLASWEFMEDTGGYKDLVNTWCAVEAYFQEWPLATDFFQPYIKGDGSPAVEFKFAVPMEVDHPITGEPLMFGGRADSIVQNSPNACYVMDEKTTKALGPSWPYQWDMRGQFYGYAFAARHYGFPCVGALVRGIAIQQTKYAFAEKPILYTDGQLQRWWETVNRRALRMVEMFKEALDWEMSKASKIDILIGIHESFPLSFGDACSSYGGCQFQDVCKSLEPWEMYSGFEKRIWNPIAEDPTAESENRLAGIEPMSFEAAMLGMD